MHKCIARVWKLIITDYTELELTNYLGYFT
jgi:hypothetical protein